MEKINFSRSNIKKSGIGIVGVLLLAGCAETIGSGSLQADKDVCVEQEFTYHLADDQSVLVGVGDMSNLEGNQLEKTDDTILISRNGNEITFNGNEDNSVLTTGNISSQVNDDPVVTVGEKPIVGTLSENDQIVNFSLVNGNGLIDVTLDWICEQPSSVEVK